MIFLRRVLVRDNTIPSFHRLPLVGLNHRTNTQQQQQHREFSTCPEKSSPFLAEPRSRPSSNHLYSPLSPRLNVATKLLRPRRRHRFILNRLPNLGPVARRPVPRPPDMDRPRQLGDQDHKTPFRELHARARTAAVPEGGEMVAVWMKGQGFFVGGVSGFEPPCRVENVSVRVNVRVREDGSMSRKINQKKLFNS